MLVVKKFLELIGDMDLFSIAKGHSLKSTSIEEPFLVEAWVRFGEDLCEVESHGNCRWACAVHLDDICNRLKVFAGHVFILLKLLTKKVALLLRHAFWAALNLSYKG